MKALIVRIFIVALSVANALPAPGGSKTVL